MLSESENTTLSDSHPTDDEPAKFQYVMDLEYGHHLGIGDCAPSLIR